MIVARYNDQRKLVAIHLSMDEDFASRLAAAEANEEPPEGGFYLMFPAGPDGRQVEC